jgi:hypothetical protein
VTTLVLVVDPTGDNWNAVSLSASWSWWAEAGIAFANLVSATVFWPGLKTTVWRSVVWTVTSEATVVLWVLTAINIVASLWSTDSLWATSVVLDALVVLVLGTVSDESLVALSKLVFKSHAMHNSIDGTSAWEAGLWDTVPWSLFTSSRVVIPGSAISNLGTVSIDTMSVWWSGTGVRWGSGGSARTIVMWSSGGARTIIVWGGGTRTIVKWSGGSDIRADALLGAAIIIGSSEPVGLTLGTVDQSASCDIASALQSLATAVLRSRVDITLLIVLAAFWLWAGDSGALFWSADVLVATVVNLVANKALVQTTLWHWWAVSIETLNVSSLTTIANSANITLIVPRLSEESSTLVVIDTSWWLWGG